MMNFRRRKILKLASQTLAAAPLFAFLRSSVAFPDSSELSSDTGLRKMLKENIPKSWHSAIFKNPDEYLLLPSEKVLTAIRELPDFLQNYGFQELQLEELRKDISTHFSLPQEQIRFMPGSTETLRMATRQFGSGKGVVVMPNPDFRPLRTHALEIGAHVREIPVDRDLRVDLERLALEKKSAHLYYFSNPHHPLGSFLEANHVLEFVHSVDPVPVLVDECYIQFLGEDYASRSVMSAVEKLPNLIVSRTFSKIYSLAGLRVAYYAFSKKLAKKLDLNERSLSIPALVAARTAFAEESRLKLIRNYYDSLRPQLTNLAKKFGLLPTDRGFGTYISYIFPQTRPPSLALQAHLKKQDLHIYKFTYGHWLKANCTPANLLILQDAFNKYLA